jgi:hypothetical protein
MALKRPALLRRMILTGAGCLRTSRTSSRVCSARVDHGDDFCNFPKTRDLPPKEKSVSNSPSKGTAL